jgi:HSP20 family protein
MLSTWNALPIFDRFFDDVLSGASGIAYPPATYSPAIDVRANDNEIVFVCEVPGLSQEDLEVNIDSDILTIQGQRVYEGNEKDRVWLGRSYGSFKKRYTLPDNVDTEGMAANLANGILTVIIPKKPQAKPRRIEIGTTSKQLGQNKE